MKPMAPPMIGVIMPTRTEAAALPKVLSAILPKVAQQTGLTLADVLEVQRLRG